MTRPPSTHGGRPHTIRVRVSGAELAMIEKARGDLTMSTYVRHVLAHRPMLTPGMAQTLVDPTPVAPQIDKPPPHTDSSQPISSDHSPDHDCNWVPAGNLFLRCTICDHRTPRRSGAE